MCIHGFGWETEGNNDLENTGIDGRIKMDLKKIGWGVGGVVWKGYVAEHKYIN